MSQTRQSPPNLLTRVKQRDGWAVLAVGIAVPVAIASVVVLARLALHRPLANDEATSYFIAQLDWSGLWESLETSEANGSIFYIALHFWKGLGTSEFVLRLLPAAFGLATLPVSFLATRALFNAPAAVASTILLAVNAWFISLAQDLRSYSLSGLLCACSTLLFALAVQRKSTKLWAGYSFVSALSVYAHFFGIFVIGAHVISLLALGRGRLIAKNVVAAYAAIAVLISPLIYFAVFNDVGQVDWIPKATPERLYSAVHDLSGMPDHPLAVLAYLLPVAILASYTVWVRVRDGAGERTWSHAVIVLWALLPIVAAYLVSLFKPLFVARYLSVGLTALTACVAVAVSMLPRVAAYAATALFVSLSLAFTLSNGDEVSTGGWEAKAELVMNRARPGDASLFYSPTIVRPFGYYSGYYRELSGPRAPGPVYPPLDWLGYSATRFNPDLTELAMDIARRDRVWFIKGYVRDAPRQRELADIESVLRASCGRADTYLKGSVRLFDGCR
jgi:mannosyltransferase